MQIVRSRPPGPSLVPGGYFLLYELVFTQLRGTQEAEFLYNLILTPLEELCKMIVVNPSGMIWFNWLFRLVCLPGPLTSEQYKAFFNPIR